MLQMTREPRDYLEDAETTAERAEELERMFRASLDRWGVKPTGDDRVTEEVAARLLGYAPGSLANKRLMGDAPRAFRIGRSITYRVRDLGLWLADRLEEF